MIILLVQTLAMLNPPHFEIHPYVSQPFYIAITSEPTLKKSSFAHLRRVKCTSYNIDMQLNISMLVCT